MYLPFPNLDIEIPTIAEWSLPEELAYFCVGWSVGLRGHQ
jgi:hypothetical protein